MAFRRTDGEGHICFAHTSMGVDGWANSLQLAVGGWQALSGATRQLSLKGNAAPLRDKHTFPNPAYPDRFLKVLRFLTYSDKIRIS